MKRWLLVLVVAFASAQLVLAQISVSCGSPEVDVQVKRCFVQGEDVCMDLIFTGLGRMEKIYISHYTEAFDDEGNKYVSTNVDIPFSIHFEYDQEKGVSGFWLDIPKDVPRKVRMRMVKADEYASSVMLVKMPCDGYNGGHFSITLKNVPISR